MVFHFRTKVPPEWIDYNGHLRDSYFGHIFSLAVDSFQDEVGFDAAYREQTNCTIYLLEDHKLFLREVMQGEVVDVETWIAGVDPKKFQLHMTMKSGGQVVAIGEFMLLHVRKTPPPQSEMIPEDRFERLKLAYVSSQKELHHLDQPIMRLSLSRSF